MQYPNLITSLKNIANYLDAQGQYESANAVDGAIRVIAFRGIFDKAKGFLSGHEDISNAQIDINGDFFTIVSSGNKIRFVRFRGNRQPLAEDRGILNKLLDRSDIGPKVKKEIRDFLGHERVAAADSESMDIDAHFNASAGDILGEIEMSIDKLKSIMDPSTQKKLLEFAQWWQYLGQLAENMRFYKPIIDENEELKKRYLELANRVKATEKESDRIREFWKNIPLNLLPSGGSGSSGSEAQVYVANFLNGRKVISSVLAADTKSFPRKSGYGTALVQNILKQYTPEEFEKKVRHMADEGLVQELKDLNYNFKNFMYEVRDPAIESIARRYLSALDEYGGEDYPTSGVLSQAAGRRNSDRVVKACNIPEELRLELETVHNELVDRGLSDYAKIIDEVLRKMESDKSYKVEKETPGYSEPSVSIKGEQMMEVRVVEAKKAGKPCPFCGDTKFHNWKKCKQDRGQSKSQGKGKGMGTGKERGGFKGPKNKGNEIKNAMWPFNKPEDSEGKNIEKILGFDIPLPISVFIPAVSKWFNAVVEGQDSAVAKAEVGVIMKQYRGDRAAETRYNVEDAIQLVAKAYKKKNVEADAAKINDIVNGMASQIRFLMQKAEVRYPNMVASLRNIANYLDDQGQFKSADVIEHAMKVIAQEHLGTCDKCGEPLRSGDYGYLCRRCRKNHERFLEESKNLSPGEKAQLNRDVRREEHQDAEKRINRIEWHRGK